MNYDFPRINHINDVLPAIEGRDEFVVAERGDYTIINYNVVKPDTFEGTETYHGRIRRECRGIVFDKNGDIFSRRLHKFFNVGEREETQIGNVRLTDPHVILEKLDGSMVTPLLVDNEVVFATKMGHETDVAKSATEFLLSDSEQAIKTKSFFIYMCVHGFTPIFEYCSRKHRIVVDYPEEKLVLLAIRNIITGNYMSYESTKDFASIYGIPVVKEFPGNPKGMAQLVELTRGQEEGEGWIVRFDDGHMVKIKSEQYLRLHKTKEKMMFERNVVLLILNNEIDDLKGMMHEDDLSKILEYEKSFWHWVDGIVEAAKESFSLAKKVTKDRAQFAEHIKKYVNAPFHGIMFGMYDGKDARELYLKAIENGCSSNVKFERVKSTHLPMLKEWIY